MQEEYRLGKHRGKWVAVRGRGIHKQRSSLGLEAKPHRKQEAQRQVRELNVRLAAIRPGEDTTVAVIFEAYLRDRELDKVPSVWRMRQAWKPLEPHFGHLTPDLIDKDTCRAYIKQRRDHGVSNGGIKTELDYLSTALRFGKSAKLYPGDRPEIMRPPAGRPRERFLTHEEARRLIRGAVAYHIKVFIQLSLTSAARPSHVLQLPWDRVNLRSWTHPETGVVYHGWISFDDPDRDATKKGRARVPINDDALEVLKVAKDLATTRWVIEYNGGPVLRVNKGIQEAARRAKLKGVSPYVLRHTAAVWMAQAGIPMAEISQYLGHSSTQVTERVYARFHPDHLRRAADALRLSETPKRLEHKR
jgi:integrase